MADNILPFQRRNDTAGYAPGVAPFDSSNPDHIRAWNALFALGSSDFQRCQLEQAYSPEANK